MTWLGRVREAVRVLRGEALYPVRAAGNVGTVGPSSLDADDPFLYKPRIVAEQLVDRWSEECRNVMAWEHPWATKTTYSVSQYLWSNQVEVADADGMETEEGPVAGAVNRLEELHWRDALYRLCVGERIHQYAVLVLRGEGEDSFRLLERGPGWRNPGDPFMYRVPAMDEVGQLDVFWQSDLVLEEENIDEFGWPASYRYYYADDEYVDIAASRCVLVSTRPMDRTFLGMPMLCPGWDYLVWSLTGLDSLAWAISKYGQTSIAVPTFGGLSSEQKANVETALQEWHKTRPLLYDQNAVKAPEFVRPFDSVDLSPMVMAYAQMYASSINAPVLWLLGEKVGAVTGSEIDTRHVQAMLHQTFTLWEPTLWRIIGAVAPEALDAADEYVLKNPLEAHLSELEQTTVWQGKASAVQGLLSVATPNEVRQAVFGWEPLEGMDETPLEREKRRAEEARQSMRFEVSAPGGRTPGGKPPRGESEPPSFVELEEAFMRYGSLRKVCKALRTSHNTVYKQRERYRRKYGREPPF